MDHVRRKHTPIGLWVIIGLYVLNALSTAIMYIRTLHPAYHAASFDHLTLMAYAIADVPFSVIPALAAAYGLWRQRRWGWVLALMTNAVQFHSMTVIFTENMLKGHTSPMPTIMTPVAGYLFAFSVVSSVYLIRIRSLFEEGMDHSLRKRWQT